MVISWAAFGCTNRQFKGNTILDYIGGYIVRGILNKIICPECINLLIKDNFHHEYGH